MTKADIVNRIAEETGMEKHDVQSTVEAVSYTHLTLPTILLV